MAAIEPKTVTLKNSQEVCIRTRQLEDTPAVVKYMDAIFTDDRFFMITAAEVQEWKTPEKINERTRELLENPNCLKLVAEVAGQIVSTSDIRSGKRQRNRHVGAVGISVREDYRGLGLGTVMLQMIIDWAIAHPMIEKLALGVWGFNDRAFGLYQKMGFAEEGRRPREAKFGANNYADEILMYRDVRTGASNGSD